MAKSLWLDLINSSPCKGLLMNGINDNDENIDLLCKKYFRQELCNDLVTETKQTLVSKLYSQLVMYGKKISRKYSSIDQDEVDDIIQETIHNCFEQWKKSPLENYTLYYGIALKNSFIRKNKKNKKINENEISLHAPIQNGNEENCVLENILADSSSDFVMTLNSIEEAKERFRFINTCFRAKKREDWWKGIITCYFYEDLHTFFARCDSEPMQRYSFIDMTIYNWEHKPTQKDVAQFFNKDEGQLSRALHSFVEYVKEACQMQGDKS